MRGYKETDKSEHLFMPLKKLFVCITEYIELPFRRFFEDSHVIERSLLTRQGQDPGKLSLGKCVK